jgi:hypothetical protein
MIGVLLVIVGKERYLSDVHGKLHLLI